MVSNHPPITDPGLAFLAGDGHLGAMIAAQDWASTSLGPIASWPQCLKTTLGLLLRSPIAMALLWGQDGVMFYNDAYAAFVGNHHPRLLGAPIREGWPELAGLHANAMRVGLAGGALSHKDLELTLQRNGRPEQVWMNLDCSPVLDECNAPAGIVAIVADTTERVLAERRARAERERAGKLFQQATGFMCLTCNPDHVFEMAALRDSEERFRTLFNTLTEGFITATLIRDAAGRVCDYRFVTVAPWFRALTGLAPEEVVGKTLVGVFGPVSDAWLQALDHAATDGNVRAEEYFAALDRWYDASIHYLNDDRVAIFFTDVTKRRRVEDQLRQERAHFATVLDYLPVGVWYAGQDGKIVYSNPMAKEIWGGERQVNISGYGQFKGWWRRDGRPVAPTEWAAARAIARGEVSLNEEIEIETFDGRRKVILNSAIPLRDGGGGIQGTIIVNQDITDRIAMEDALRQAKSEADRANLAKSKFLATASHDLRQPVQSLVLFLAALREGTAGSKLAKPIKFMEQAVDALTIMLNGLLDLSRLDAGVVLPKILPIDIGAMLGRFGEEYAVRAEERGLRLRTRGRSMSALADPEFLERVLRNLVENALRYTETGGIIMCCRQLGCEVRIDVIDSGMGISPEHQKAIFDEYFQVGNEARDRTMGLGLGLAIVRRLLGLIGGRIDVASRLGRGSRFSVFLPAAADAAQPEPMSQAGPFGQGKTALVIDDEPIVRASLCMMLESWGFTVIEAGTGNEARRRIRGMPGGPDIVLADYRLRQSETGIEAARAIGTQCGRSIPTLIITGDTEPQRIREVHGTGFMMLHKPVGADDLRKALAHIVLG